MRIYGSETASTTESSSEELCFSWKTLD